MSGNLLGRIRSSAEIAKRYTRWYWDHRNVPKAEMLSFRCNICGGVNRLGATKFGRETGGCLFCGSTVRWRSVIHALSMELFGESRIIAEFPVQKNLQGIGLSDWSGYASRLATRFSYKNTFYHCDPQLDISNPDPREWGKYDFLISTDVFEHVPPPIDAAFEGARNLLKPGGLMIFSVPYVQGITKEHFPDLHRFSLQKRNHQMILVNETADGKKEEFSDITFHGGPGSTIEMRLFGKESLLSNFQHAGLGLPHLYSEEVREFGILWLKYNPEEAPYRPLIYGLDTPPWTVRRRC